MARLTLKKGSWLYYLIQDDHVIQAFCSRDFQRITGIKLKPGEVREIESIKIKLKPAREKK